MNTFARIARFASIFPTLILFAVVLIAMNSAASPAAAQCPGQWIPGQQSLGWVKAFVTMPNGDLYAGGSAGVFRWNGTSWDALPGITGTVRSLINFNGDLVAGGSGSASGVRRWNGLTWTLLGPAVGYVEALTVFNNELVGSGGLGGGNVSRWDGTNWHPIGNSLNLLTAALTVYNGSLIAGGYFEQNPITGAGAQGIGIWNGTEWHTLGSGLYAHSDAPVLAFSTYGGELFAGGEFGHRVSRLNGTTWQDTNYPWLYVWALAVHQGDLFAGIGCNCPTSDPYIHQLHNGTWQPIFLGGGNNGNINALASHGDDLFVGGSIISGWGIYRTTCPRGDLNADGLVNDADQAILINVLLDIDEVPDHVTRADLNDDGHPDGLDIAIFTACRTDGCP